MELAGLHVSLPRLPLWRWAVTRGRGTELWVDGEGLEMRHKGRRDVPPMFAIRKFRFAVDTASLFGKSKIVPLVEVEGLKLNLPPKEDRPSTGGGGQTAVQIEEVQIRDAELMMLPRDRAKKPLRFAIHQLTLHSEGSGAPMKYDARLTNPTPPGEIHSVGDFGPWQADEPGDTPLRGDYTFDHADLGVFRGIAGILTAHGRFEGELDTITATRGGDVIDFRAETLGQSRALSKATYEVLVDGTNGDTTLKPVVATLGATRFTTSGVVFKNEGDAHRQIQLDVNMPDGRMRDVLLARDEGQSLHGGQASIEDQTENPALDRQGSGENLSQRRIRGERRALFAIDDSGSDRWLEPAGAGPAAERPDRRGDLHHDRQVQFRAIRN